jgi:hypothetical protein
VDDHHAYAVLPVGLGTLGAGRILGRDRKLEETDPVENNPWMASLLG